MKARTSGQYFSVALAVVIAVASLAMACGMVRFGATHHGWNVAAAAYGAVVLGLLSGLTARASVSFWRA